MRELCLKGLWQYLAPAGWATQWYWPPNASGQRIYGKLHNLTHGRGWQVR